MPEHNGQTVNPSKKSEINLLVDLVGLSELLKLCPIDSVLLPVKKIKPESLLKIYYLVVHLVDQDVVEVTHHLLGLIIQAQDLFPEISMEIPKDVNPTNSQLVLITYILLNTQIAQPLNIAHHHALANVNLPPD